jgi:hypothetical protein
VIGRDESLPTTIEEGLDDAKGQRVEILPTDGVVWCVTPKSVTQSWTEVGGGWTVMELKELASDYWSQLTPSQGFHPGPEVACWYSGCYCCCGDDPDRRPGVATKACGRCCPAGTGPGYIVMCPCHGWP